MFNYHLFPKVILVSIPFSMLLCFFFFTDAVSGSEDDQKIPTDIKTVSPHRNGSINSPVSFVKTVLGIDIRSILPADIDQHGLESSNGVVITSLTSTSPLIRIGFEEKDLIFEINSHEIMGPDDFINVFNKMERHQWITIRAMDHRTGKIGYVQFFLQ
jgi:S1-C subfamily serine protease